MIRSALLATAFAMAVSGCSAQADNASDVEDAGVFQTQASNEPEVTGVPAPASREGEPSAASRVISMEEMPLKFPDRGSEPGCFITFAYRGHPPETLIWDGEPCSKVSAQFGDRTFLEAYDNWAALDEYQQSDVEKLPDGKAFYVEGEFAAAIYPIGTSGTTYEIWVSD